MRKVNVWLTFEVIDEDLYFDVDNHDPIKVISEVAPEDLDYYVHEVCMSSDVGRKYWENTDIDALIKEINDAADECIARRLR